MLDKVLKLSEFSICKMGIYKSMNSVLNGSYVSLWVLGMYMRMARETQKEPEE
jgi:hypothetical protein